MGGVKAGEWEELGVGVGVGGVRGGEWEELGVESGRS